MSHIAKVGESQVVEEQNLGFLFDAVKETCPTCEVVKQTTYRTWISDHGGLAGDWAPPEGWPVDQLGKNATYAIRVKPEIAKKLPDKNPYEIGIVRVKKIFDTQGNFLRVVPDKAGKHFALSCDFWRQGCGILNQPGIGKHSIGEDKKEKCFGELLQSYRNIQIKHLIQSQGCSILQQQKLDNGKIVYRIGVK